jgi:hypothetical protein
VSAAARPDATVSHKENKMEKRQMILGAVAAVVLLGAGGFYFMMQSAEEMPADDMTMVTPKPVAPAPAPAAPPAPVVATPAPESDAVALGEEEGDRVKAEAAYLAARAADLEAQVKDGEMILDAQAKKMARLEAELKKLGVKPAPAK